MAFDWSPYATGGAARPDSFTGMDPAFNEALARMFQGAPENIRNNLRVKSGYRSPERQTELWKAALQKYGSPEAARKWVAPPGKSQHNHGNAADLSFLDPAALQWAHQNASQYGLAFPLSNENWHVELATARGPDGPKGQEAYQAPVFGSMAPGMAQDTSIPMGVANYWDRLPNEQGQKQNPLEKAGAALTKAADEFPAPRINSPFGGDARQSGDVLQKLLSNPQALAQMLMQRRMA